MISLSPTLSAWSSPRDPSAAAAPAWTELGESASGASLDLFVCGILAGDDGTLTPRADSGARPQATGQLAVAVNLLLSTETQRVSLHRAMMTPPCLTNKRARPNQCSGPAGTKITADSPRLPKWHRAVELSRTHRHTTMHLFTQTVWWLRPIQLAVS